jgi:hypothetical protein
LPARYRKLTQALGVTGTVAIEASPWSEDNQWLLDLARINPIIVGMVGHLSPGTSEFKDHHRELEERGVACFDLLPGQPDRHSKE